MRTYLIMLAMLMTANIYAIEADTIKTKSKITNVTVFFNGAQVTRTADLKLKKGKHILVLGQLPQQMNPQSIQVNGIPGCKTLSVKHQQQKSSDGKKSAEEEALHTSIKANEAKIRELKSKYNVYGIEEKIILDNSILGSSEKNLTVAEIQAAADFYRERLTSIRVNKLNINAELENLNEKIQEIYTNLNQLLAEKNKSYTELLVALECEKDINSTMTFSYYISSAGWNPLYDFRVDDITKPLTIVYNANVYQSSGEDWKDVKVKLSTSNPMLSGQVPELNAWYIDQRPVEKRDPLQSETAALRGKVVDKDTKEPIPFVNIILEKNGVQAGGTTSDFDGNYAIKPIHPGTYSLKATFVGYKPVLINGVVIKANQITFEDFMLESTIMEMAEVEITDYKVPLIDKDYTSGGGTLTSQEINRMPGRSASATATKIGGVFSADGERGSVGGKWDGRTVGYVDGVRVTDQKRDVITTSYLSNTVTSNVTNLEYDIDIPYSIPSDGEDYTLKIKDVSLPVNYVYHIIPKIDNDAFLTAEITDWSELNLLSGKSSIYYQGSFVGESEINAEKTADTLTVSLGRDNNIKVTREGDKTVYDKRTVGNYIKQVSGWNITIRNNRKSMVHIIVEDQYPLSEKKSVEVSLLNSTDASVTEKTGNLKWTIDIPANEKKELKFSYSVKYPRFERVYLD